MNKEQIKQLALACGFKLKEQADGTMDLNPYVYEFAEKVYQKSKYDTEYEKNHPEMFKDE